MEIPFTYGRIVSGEDFTDRTQETRQLVDNFLSLTNTGIISPRRWGKSSLVNKAIKVASGISSDLLFVRINAFKCESAQDFYELLARKTIEGISPSADSLLANAREFISRLLPRLTLSDSLGQYQISFGVDFKQNPIGEDILDLPQQIAVKRKKKVIVCIDEFQQVGEFEMTGRFQKILRSHWQEHSDVAYILYGSKRHMMLDIFGNYESPFYKFGDLMFLSKISNADWTEYIVSRFKETGKQITPAVASYLAEEVENHPYYVQQLAQYSWLRSGKECTEETVSEAFSGMLDALNLQFFNLMDSLTEKQRNFLCAIADGEKFFSSIGTLSKYKLGTSGNVRVLKNALQKKDLIDAPGPEITIQDPVFKRWIKQEYKSLD